MDNRRHTSTTAPKKPYRKKYYKKDDQNSSDYKGGYKSRNSRSQDKDDRYSNQGGKYKSNNGRYNPKTRFQKDGKGSPPWKRQPELPKIVSEMQITDGKHRGKYLKSSDSPNVKPTTRRIRETMFRILFRKVRAGRFLDLCAGSGAVGLEAISRGSLLSTFVERKAKMCNFIRKNMENLEIKEGHGEIFEMEAVPFLKKMAKRRRFWDVVFYDPPYDTDYDEVLSYFERGVSIKPGGILVIEHHTEMFFPERIGVMKRWRVIVQGETAISFYDRRS